MLFPQVLRFCRPIPTFIFSREQRRGIEGHGGLSVCIVLNRFDMAHRFQRESCVGLTVQDILVLIISEVQGTPNQYSQSTFRQTTCNTLHTKHLHNTSVPRHLSNYKLASPVCRMLRTEPSCMCELVRVRLACLCVSVLCRDVKRRSLSMCCGKRVSASPGRAGLKSAAH